LHLKNLGDVLELLLEIGLRDIGFDLKSHKKTTSVHGGVLLTLGDVSTGFNHGSGDCMDYPGSIRADKGQDPVFFNRLHQLILLAPISLSEVSLVNF
jgi:hypothetical protein